MLALLALSLIAPAGWQPVTDWTGIPDPATDWDVFRLAARDLLAGDNPYQRPAPDNLRYYNPVWTLIPLIPFMLLPRGLSLLAINAASLLSLLVITRALGYRSWEFGLLAVSAPMAFTLANGNIEVLAWWGLLLPTPLALVFWTMKPQSTIGLILFRLWQTFQDGGIRKLLLTLAPVALLTIMTLVLYGLPPATSQRQPFWPWSFVPGLLLLGYSFARRLWRGAAAASPFLSPYAHPQSWLCVLFTFRGWALALAVLVSWGIALWAW